MVLTNQGVLANQPGRPPILLWDDRLRLRGVRLFLAKPQPGQSYWRVTSGEWRDVAQSQGRRAVFLELLDEAGARVVGVPVRFSWPTGEQIKESEAKPNDDYAIDFPMSNAHGLYSVEIWGAQSDRIEGLGLGTIAEPYRPALTSYRFCFQRTLSDDDAMPVEAQPPDIRQAITREVQIIRASLANIDTLLEMP